MSEGSTASLSDDTRTKGRASAAPAAQAQAGRKRLWPTAQLHYTQEGKPVCGEFNLQISGRNVRGTSFVTLMSTLR